MLQTINKSDQFTLNEFNNSLNQIKISITGFWGFGVLGVEAFHRKESGYP